MSNIFLDYSSLQKYTTNTMEIYYNLVNGLAESRRRLLHFNG